MTIVIRHGTAHAWNYHRCRCERCRAWQAERIRVWRERQSFTLVNGVRVSARGSHGDAHTYINYGCRCDPCTKAHAARLRAQRASSRDLS